VRRLVDDDEVEGVLGRQAGERAVGGA